MKNEKKKRHGNCKDFLDWETAKELMREEMLGSRREYHIYLKLYEPPLPHSPWQHYPQWKSWNDYLGVDTQFPSKQYFKSYKDCWAFARSCPARTQNEWTKLYRDGQIPRIYPARPDCYYRGQFSGWRSFLAVSLKPQDAIQQAQLEMSPHSQSDTYYIGYDRASGFYMMAWSKDMLASCSSIMAWDVDNRTLLSEIQNRHCQHQGGGEYLIGNVHEFLFEMNTTFIPTPTQR